MKNLAFDNQTHQCEQNRYFYTKNKLFEQSLDIYEPKNSGDDEDDYDNLSKPLIVLVVGSAWMGHRSIIYSGTSWWNSSAPMAFAKLGYTCVSIRHRGTFPQVPSLPVVLSFLAAVAAFLLGALQCNWLYVVQITSIIFIFWASLVIGGYGAANFDDMIQDVADALVWIDDNVMSNLPPVENEEEKKEEFNERLFLFGGYSSGAHVAASLLQRSDLFTSRGLPPPEELIDGVIFLSGVLAVRPRVKKIGNSNIFRKDTEVAKIKKEAQMLQSNPQPSRWFVDLLTLVAFGEKNASAVPSPFDGIPPRIPHLFMGCTREVFGLSLMDLLFCSKEFSKLVEAEHKGSIPSRCVEIESVNHWNILASHKFSQVLCNELKWITNVATIHQERK